ncbi:hypothetical protein BGX27_009365 [Mortierella sp. AM989]|nr:hypothetical protein BGX27_009365 [Mortierella sp. AM989]
MKFISHIRSISSKTIPHSPSPTSGVQTTITPVVTQIPEILWEIFSYLSQPDLIYGVSGVNRLWRSISADLVRGEIHWGDTFTLRNQNMCLARLGFIQVKTLHCLSQDKRTYPAFHQGVEQDVEDAWKRLMQTISFLTERGEHIGQDGMTTTRKLLPWRKIVYSGWNWFNERWDPLIQQYYLSMYGVRALHLKRITPGTVDLSCIFSKLLNLEELVIQSLETPPLTYKRNCTITWKERQDLVKEGQDKDNQQAQMQVLKLRTFKIHHLIVNQDALETILGAMPTLHTLELKFMICNNPHSGVSINRLTFIKFLAQHCPDLIHFHFSISGSRITIEEIQQIHVAFPKVTSLSLPACDIIPGSLDFLVDRLTRLEIDCSEYTHAPGLGDKLHNQASSRTL